MYIPRRLSRIDTHEYEEAEQEAEQANQEEQQNELLESTQFLRTDSNRRRIESACKDYAFKAMKLIVSDNEHCLDRDIMIHLVGIQEKRNRGFVTLPFSLVFFMVFALTAFLHEDVSTVFVVESGLRKALGQGAGDIKTIQDTWEWLNGTIFPTVFRQTDFQGRPLEDKMEWSRILSYNSLMGALFMEQERSTKQLCEDESGIAADMYCYDTETSDTSAFGRSLARVDESGVLHSSFPITPPQAGDYDSPINLTLSQRVQWYNSPFQVVGGSGRRLRITRPTYAGRLSGTSNTAGIATEGAFRAVFSPNMRYELIQERLDYMLANGWLDKQTKHLSLRALLLNNEVGRPRLQSYKLTLSFSRAGDVWAKLTMDTIFLESYYDGIAQAADIVFAVMLFGSTCFEIFSIVGHCRNGEFRGQALTGWFVLQWMIVILGWAVLLGYQYISSQIHPVKTDMLGISKLRLEDFPAELNELGEDLHSSASIVAFFAAWHRLLVAVYHLILMIRFFVAFRAQPRLGVVVNTLEMCLIDVLHFMIILLPCFLAYAISGSFIFGRRVEDFSDFQAALGICFKIVTESEYDWPYLSEEHFWTTVIWVWTFMLFMSMVMLNLLLAIVLDIYSEQRRLAGKSEGICQTISQMASIVRYWKRWVPIPQLLDGLSKMPRMITREDFLRAFPGMPDKQVELLISGSQQLASNIHAGPEHQQHTMRMAMAMKVAMDEVTEDIEELDNGSYGPQDDDPTLKIQKPSWLAEVAQELSSQNHAMLAMQWRLQQLDWAWQALNLAHGKETQFDLREFEPRKPSERVL